MKTFNLNYYFSPTFGHFFHSSTHLSIGRYTIEIIATQEFDSIKEYRLSLYSATKSKGIALDIQISENEWASFGAQTIILNTLTKIVTVS